MQVQFKKNEYNAIIMFGIKNYISKIYGAIDMISSAAARSINCLNRPDISLPMYWP
jgi:hypothetical protein